MDKYHNRQCDSILNTLQASSELCWMISTTGKFFVPDISSTRGVADFVESDSSFIDRMNSCSGES